jgi:hypothetical protein
MATSEILGKFPAEVEPACTLTSIANGAGRICAVIDNSTTRCRRGILAVKAKTGTSPTSSTVFKWYLIRQSNGTSNVKGGGGTLGDSDAAVSTEPNNAPIVGIVVVTSTSNTEYNELFIVDEPGEKFSFVFWNATGVTSHGTAPTPTIQWTPILDESQ